MSTEFRPAWVDLSADDVNRAGEFYSQLFGWKVQVAEDPQYGGYAMAQLDGRDVAGIGPKQVPGQPSAWSVYVGTADVDALARRVAEAGGTVVAQPFDVGDQGRMAVFQDPSGTFISAWQTAAMEPFQAGKPNTFVWAELNARGVDSVIPFYTRVFDWGTVTDEDAPGPRYTRFTAGGEEFGGAMEMPEMVPAEVPNYWLTYFGVEDVDAIHARALELGARELAPPMDSPGGRFSVLTDPEGAAFAINEVHA